MRQNGCEGDYEHGDLTEKTPVKIDRDIFISTTDGSTTIRCLAVYLKHWPNVPIFSRSGVVNKCLLLFL